jgi:hypothetical protein
VFWLKFIELSRRPRGVNLKYLKKNQSFRFVPLSLPDSEVVIATVGTATTSSKPSITNIERPGEVLMMIMNFIKNT